MVTEVQKYRSRLFQILGFSFMAPFGRLMLIILTPQPIDLNLKFILILSISLILAFMGIIFIVKGEEHLYVRYRWIKKD